MLLIICFWFLLSVKSVFAVDGTFELYPNCEKIYDMLRKDDNLWLGTSGGLVCLDVKNGDCSLMDRPLLDSVIRHPDLCVGPDGSVCALLNTGLTSDTTLGVGSFQDGEWSVIPFQVQSGHGGFRNLLYDREGTLWAFGGVVSSGPGIFRYDGEWEYLDVIEFTGSKDVYSMAEGPNGEIWFAPYGGLMRYYNEVWIWFPFEGSHPFMNITVDRDGTVWGVNSGAVYSFQPGKFTQYPVEGQSWKPIAVDDRNCLWCASKSGIMSYEGSSWKLWDNDEVGYAFDTVLSCYTYGNEVWFSAEKDSYPFLLCYKGPSMEKIRTAE